MEEQQHYESIKQIFDGIWEIIYMPTEAFYIALSVVVSGILIEYLFKKWRYKK